MLAALPNELQEAILTWSLRWSIAGELHWKQFGSGLSSPYTAHWIAWHGPTGWTVNGEGVSGLRKTGQCPRNLVTMGKREATTYRRQALAHLSRMPKEIWHNSQESSNIWERKQWEIKLTMERVKDTVKIVNGKFNVCIITMNKEIRKNIALIKRNIAMKT